MQSIYGAPNFFILQIKKFCVVFWSLLWGEGGFLVMKMCLFLESFGDKTEAKFSVLRMREWGF